MDITRHSVLSDMMKRAVDRGECAGVQAAVVKDSREVWYAAAGMADFNPETDTTTDDVFKKADKIMYENKVAMHGGRD